MPARINHKLTGCCGVKSDVVAGIRRCSKCGREINRDIVGVSVAANRYDQLDREFMRETQDPSTRGRLTNEIR